MSQMFGTWLGSYKKDLEPLVRLRVAVMCWSLWLTMNALVFENKLCSSPLQVIFRVTHWLHKNYPSEAIFVELFLQGVFMGSSCNGFATLDEGVQ